MGVHVILDIDPQGIDPAAWAQIHDGTLKLLEAWPTPLMGWGSRVIEGQVMPMYTRSLRGDEGDPARVHWSVVGDRRSLRRAECQSLYRHLGHYSRRRRPGPATDIIQFAIDPHREDTGGPARVFGNKTQGEPYHFAVLAAAMMVEERFPDQAMVWGDIDRGQAEVAQRLAAPILGRNLSIPLRTDAPRLLDRLRTKVTGAALPRAFERLYLGDHHEACAQVLRVFPGRQGERWWRAALKETHGAGTVGTVKLLIAWLDAGRELDVACRLACLDPRGPRFAPESFVDSLASTWVAVPHRLRERLDVFQKPPDEAHTVETLLGGILLDLTLAGRLLRSHLEAPAIAAALQAAFGKAGQALTARLQARSAKIAREITRQTKGLRSFVERAHQSAADGFEDLATVPGAEVLGPNQRQGVHVMAWSVSKTLAALRRTALAADLTSPAASRRLLVRALSDQGPTLTEDAWDRLDAEKDPGVLAWLVTLAGLEAEAQEASWIRRALLENHALRTYAIKVGRNKEMMDGVVALLARAKSRPG